MKTSELTGAALDWAVARCEGEDYSPVTTYNGIGQEFPSINYSTDWAQGGPIIEREWIELEPWPNQSDESQRWMATQYDLTEPVSITGTTPLIAAMRCYVASKLGAEVEIPKELE